MVMGVGIGKLSCLAQSENWGSMAVSTAFDHCAVDPSMAKRGAATNIHKTAIILMVFSYRFRYQTGLLLFRFLNVSVEKESEMTDDGFLHRDSTPVGPFE